MLLSALPIINYCDVNSFTTGNQWTIRSGEQNTLFFQLVDLNQDKLRYLTGVGSSNQPVQVSAAFPSITDGQTISVVAAQADAADSSVFSVSLSPSQTPASGNVIFTVMEGSNVRRFVVVNMIDVEQVAGCGSC